ncbi:hypothetical protein [Arthrobacter sp. B1805]|uniref:hypothetical protein n=1 Tax=Arthrobacter sp. B1805 TaxID=2058892 RepID=UPI0011B0C66D|nr:hypothetical protein [Arthrobacter sp. B1805]
MDALKLGQDLAARISDSGHEWPGPPLNENPIWLRKVAAQAITVLREEPILYVGHTVQKGSDEEGETTYEGEVVIATAHQLLYSTILTTDVATEVYGLNEVKALQVVDVADFPGRNAAWPRDIRFNVTMRDVVLRFPASTDATRVQDEEACAMLPHFNAALCALSR